MINIHQVAFAASTIHIQDEFQDIRFHLRSSYEHVSHFDGRRQRRRDHHHRRNWRHHHERRQKGKFLLLLLLFVSYSIGHSSSFLLTRMTTLSSFNEDAAASSLVPRHPTFHPSINARSDVSIVYSGSLLSLCGQSIVFE